MSQDNAEAEASFTLEHPSPTASPFFLVLGSKVRMHGRAAPGTEMTVEGPRTVYPRADSDGVWEYVFDMTLLQYKDIVMSAYLVGAVPNRLSAACRWREYDTLPTITGVFPEGPYLPGTTFAITGVGVTGSELTVWEDGKALASARPGVYGIWTANISPKGVGQINLTVNQIDIGATPAHSLPYAVMIWGAPVIESPEQGAITDVRVEISGMGLPGATVEVLKDLDHAFKVGQATVGSNGQWRLTNLERDLPPGPFSIVARQKLQNVLSPISSARSFKVRAPALTAVSATPIGTGVKFTGSGHTGATVQITVVSGAGAAPPAVQVSNGRWETTAANWPFGTYQLRAIQKVSDNADGWIESLPYSFSVDHRPLGADAT